MSDDSAADRQRCAFCQQACPLEPLTIEEGETTLTFCSQTCRDAHEDNGGAVTGSESHRKVRPGVAGLDACLPQGLPRNSFILLLGNSGTREEAIEAELVWRALERGEPAIIVAFTEPPTSVVENFLAMDWNVLPYLERDQLHIVDCFTYRMDDRERLYDRMTAWNTHLRRATRPQTTAVRDPSDSYEVRNALDNCLEALGMVETGVVVVDSIAEFGSLVQPVQAYDFVKNVRAEVCKGRFVPIVAGATVAGEADEFPRNLDYVADGVVDLALDGSVIEDTLFRRLRVRKLRGVLTVSEWHTYEYTSGLGMVTFDPLEEVKANASDGRQETENGGDAGEKRGDQGKGVNVPGETASNGAENEPKQG
ncbi:ATPase domain-containing protein [Natrialbaceae archaeon A-CW3]